MKGVRLWFQFCVWNGLAGGDDLPRFEIDWTYSAREASGFVSCLALLIMGVPVPLGAILSFQRRLLWRAVCCTWALSMSQILLKGCECGLEVLHRKGPTYSLSPQKSESTFKAGAAKTTMPHEAR